MGTKVRVTFHPKGGPVHTAVFTKPGTKAQLCAVRKIKIKGRTFLGRRGGRTLCGPSTGKNTPSARAARREFTRTWGHRLKVAIRRRRR